MRRSAFLVLLAALFMLAAFPHNGFGQSATAPVATAAPQPAQPSAVQQDPEAQPAPAAKSSAKVWTNDDVRSLPGASGVSTSARPAPRKVSTPYKPDPGQKDAASYRKQIETVRAEIDKLDPQIAKLQAFLSGESAGGEPSVRRQMVPTPEDQLKQLEARRQADEARLNDLLDSARHHGVETGALP